MLRWLIPPDLNVSHVGSWRTVTAPADHVLDPCLRAFEDRLHAARIQVADPAGQATVVGRFHRRVAEANALDVAKQPNVGSGTVSVRHDGARPRLRFVRPGPRQSSVPCRLARV